MLSSRLFRSIFFILTLFTFKSEANSITEDFKSAEKKYLFQNITTEARKDDFLKVIKKNLNESEYIIYSIKDDCLDFHDKEYTLIYKNYYYVFSFELNTPKKSINSYNDTINSGIVGSMKESKKMRVININTERNSIDYCFLDVMKFNQYTLQILAGRFRLKYTHSSFKDLMKSDKKPHRGLLNEIFGFRN